MTNTTNTMSSKEKNFRVSVSLQGLAGIIQDYLALQAGETIGFVLVLACDDIGHHVSNCDKEGTAELLRGTLEHYEKGKADIPAHYSPDLKFDGAGPKNNADTP